MRFALASLFVVLVGCGTPGADTPDAYVPVHCVHDGTQWVCGDAGLIDAGHTDAGEPDSGIVTPDAGQDSGVIVIDSGVVDSGVVDAGLVLVDVSHQRELRAAWVSTVSRLDWPPAANLSRTAGVASLESLVNDAADAGLNALFFQVRPYADALYESHEGEPWSSYLTSNADAGPGWDPLEELLPIAHARGIEVHAWLNPYRGTVKALSQYSITYNNIPVMNPGVPAVREHVVAVVDDILSHYDVDGVHFDDYFYPYPDSSSTPFPDSATYNAYTSGGGTLSLGDWRRDNVNTLVAEVMALVKSDHPTVRFGIGPFGIWKSGQPVSGLSAYDAIYCDAVSWMSNEHVDYLAPQLYWTESSAQSYSTLVNWWAARLNGRHLFPGHADYRMLSAANGGADWPLSEIQGQLEYTRTKRSSGALGDVHFRMANLRNNLKGVSDLLGKNLYAEPAVAPALPRAEAVVAPAVPFVSLNGTTLSVTDPMPATVRSYLLYREVSAGQWELRGVKGGAQVTFTLTSGTWAVSALGRGGGESQGVRVTVP